MTRRPPTAAARRTSCAFGDSLATRAVITSLTIDGTSPDAPAAARASSSRKNGFPSARR